MPTPYTINAENFNEALTMEEGLLEVIEAGIRRVLLQNIGKPRKLI
jgi:hypothetical protein